MITENQNQENLSSTTEEPLLSFMEVNTPPQSKKATKVRRIRRRTLNLILTSAGTLLLAVILLVVLLTGNAPDSTDDPSNTDTSDELSTTPAITLLDKSGQSGDTKAAVLKSVSVENSDDRYSIVLDGQNNAYRISGYEDMDLANDMLLTLRKYTELIEATEQVKDVADLKTYGLDKPQASAVITYSDDTTAQVYIGDATPSATGYYAQIAGEDSVYIFASDAASVFRMTAAAYVNTTLLVAPTPKTDDEQGTGLLKEITYSGTAYPQPLTLRRSYHTDSEEFTYFSYIITAPYMRCTTDNVSSALSNFTSLTAEQALVLHPTKEQKAKMGFDNPLIELKATMAVETEDSSAEEDDNGKKPNIYYGSTEYHLTVGSVDEDGNYIVMINDVDAIFLVSKSSFGYVLDRTYQNSVNENLFFRNINRLSRIAIQLDGNTYDFSLAHHPEKEQQEEQMTVTMDGKVYDTEDFRELYQLIMGLKRYESAETTSTEDVPLTIALYDTDGKLYLSAKYYNTSGSLCTVETNEGERFTTRWSDVSFFMQQVRRYLNGEDVLLNT